jgi:pimeloyl-ACP methyl ester carboxylesterase
MNYLFPSLALGALLTIGVAAMAQAQPQSPRSSGQPKPAITSKTIVFIHGAFVSQDCWAEWKPYFEARGYRCVVLPWPGRGQAAATQRAANPDPARGRQTLEEILAFYADTIRKMPEPPILIGHSVGGFLVQKLLSQGLGAAGVAIHSFPPRGIFTLKWSFIKSSWPLLNPFISVNKPLLLSFEQFQYAFANGLPMAEQRAAYEAIVIPESRHLSRGLLSKTGAVAFNQTTAPLLMTAGGRDHLLPWSLQRKNFARYRKSPASVTYQEFPDRTHDVLNQTGWEAVAAAVGAWLQPQYNTADAGR